MIQAEPPAIVDTVPTAAEAAAIAAYLTLRIRQCERTAERLRKIEPQDTTKYCANSIRHYRNVIGALQWAVATIPQDKGSCK